MIDNRPADTYNKIGMVLICLLPAPESGAPPEVTPMRINNRQPAIGGVRLQIFNLVMAAAAVILSLLLIRSAYATAGA